MLLKDRESNFIYETFRKKQKKKKTHTNNYYVIFCYVALPIQLE